MRGFRIIDCTRVLAGPWATQQLADQGADVVKVEPPGGDETRGYGPVRDGVSTYFLALNRNKRSVVIDLKHPRGRAVLDRLLASADVLVDNLRTGAARRLDLTDISATHPHVVHVSIRGFAEDAPAPWSDRPGYDIALQALGGGMALTGWPDGPPLRSALPVADLITGLLAAQAVTLGLLERGRTGRGTRTVVDMMQAQAASLLYHGTRETLGGGAGPRLGNAHAGLVPYDVYRCRDGWLAVGCGNDTIWTRLVDALGLDVDSGLARNVDRVARRAEVDTLVGAALAPLTVDDADGRLCAAGVPSAPVLSPAQTLAHPGVRPVAVTHPTLGPVDLPGATLATATRREADTAPPLLGADTDAVLTEAGLSPDDIASLRAAGAVA